MTLAMLLSLVGCGTENPVATADTDAAPVDPDAPRDTLVVGFVQNVGTLVSPVMQTLADAQIIDQTTFPIMDGEFDCSLKRKPGLATEFSWSDDGKVLSMTLRDDIRWSDGKPVTADDIAFTYDLIADKEVGSPRADMVARMAPDGRPKILDPKHIEWRFLTAYDRDTQGAHANFPIVPKHALENENRATLRGAAYGKDPKVFLSSGPYRLAELVPNQRIVLEPNPAYTGPKESRSHLERVLFKIIPDYNARLLALQKGDIDMMDALRVQDADKLREKNPEIKLYKGGLRKTDFIVWNLKDPLFADREVRRALATAVDVDGVMKQILGSKTGEIYGQRAIGNITPELCAAYASDVPLIAYDENKAKEMLAAAGWKDSDGDGVVDKGGKKFEFELIVGAGNQRRAEAAVYLQNYLQKVGVKVDIANVEANMLTERMRKHEFQASFAGWSAALYVDPSDVWGTDTPEHPHEFNFTGYSNPKVDQLIDKGLSMPKPEEAGPVWKEMQAEIYGDQPYMFLWWIDEIVAVHSRFENVQVNVASTYYHLPEWRVAPDKVKYETPPTP